VHAGPASPAAPELLELDPTPLELEALEAMPELEPELLASPESSPPLEVLASKLPPLELLELPPPVLLELPLLEALPLEAPPPELPLPETPLPVPPSFLTHTFSDDAAAQAYPAGQSESYVHVVRGVSPARQPEPTGPIATRIATPTYLARDDERPFMKSSRPIPAYRPGQGPRSLRLLAPHELSIEVPRHMEIGDGVGL
jgi:hypothetical protein